MATYIAKTLQGLEPVLAQELREIGATDVQESGRAVLFEASQEVLYKANYLCRTALRIMKKLKSFDIERQDDLYEEINALAWEKIIPVDSPMTVSVSCKDSVFSHSRFAAQRIKDAVVDRFRRILSQWPYIDNEYYTIRLELFMRKNHCEFFIDASGLSLHNRGYRKPHTSSFNEVMAAGLLRLSGWTPGKKLLLPFSKNGLLAMEAAMQVRRMPAGYFRKGYSFQYWNDYDPGLWKEVKEEALAGVRDNEGGIWALGETPLSAERMKEAFERVGMEQGMVFRQFDFLENDSIDEFLPLEDAVIIARLPFFGEERWEAADDFCTHVGNVLKQRYTGAQAWLYGYDMDSFKFVGLKPKEKFLLGEVERPARFWGFDMR